MRIGIDLDDVILSRDNKLINDAEKEFGLLRSWAGPSDHKGAHQLVCITSRPEKYLITAMEALMAGNIEFDEYHFLGGRHKYVVHVDYLVDNSLVVKENWLKHNPAESFILFWTPETNEGIKKLSDVIPIISS